MKFSKKHNVRNPKPAGEKVVKAPRPAAIPKPVQKPVAAAPVKAAPVKAAPAAKPQKK